MTSINPPHPHWRVRVEQEKSDLDARIERLHDALVSEGFREKVGLIQFDLMSRQISAMRAYSSTLRERLECSSSE